MALDEEAITALYRRYAPSVMRRARAILGDSDEARDVVHEVFMKAMASEREFEGEQSPMTWLYRVTTNHCIDVLRVRGRRAELLAAHGDELHSGGEGLDPDRRRILRGILARVPDELKEVAIYFYVDDMTQDEIARHLGCSRRTVGYRLESFRTLAQAMIERGGRA